VSVTPTRDVIELLLPELPLSPAQIQGREDPSRSSLSRGCDFV
jgi:hypothetical protein